MTNNTSQYKVVDWAMKNYKIVILLSVFFILIGIYSLMNMPKQEYPSITVRQGLVVGVYPGASPKQVEERLTKPLEEYLFRYKEVKRKNTYSYSRNGVAYIYVELEDNVKNKDEVWSKIKHGLLTFKQTLTPDIQAIIVDDDFGSTSSLLLTVSSSIKTYRQLEEYTDKLVSNLRTVESVSKLEKYGTQKEEISILLNKQKLASYNIPVSALALDIFTDGMVNYAGEIDNKKEIMPIHLRNSIETVPDIQEKIVYTDPLGHFIRLKDIADVRKEYPKSEGYIEHNGIKTVVLSIEMQEGKDIIHFGNEVKVVINQFKSGLPKDIAVDTIVDQSQVVDNSVSSFLIEMLIAICSVILVTVILLPFRVAGVAAISIPITIFISLTILYVMGFELNIVNFAALIVVLGLIVDDCIVIVDGYIDYIDEGYSRWHASIMSAKEYFKSLITATLAISITFFPFLFTFKGTLLDFIVSFPWTMSITLFVSLGVAIIIIPVIQYFFIKKGLHEKNKTKKPSFLDNLQKRYDNILPFFFSHSKIVFSVVILSLVLAYIMVGNINMRMMPLAERNLLSVEIYLPKGTSLDQTKTISDSMNRILKKDERVLSVTSFIGANSPRFHTLYTPKIPSKSYAQLIVNTSSNEKTNEIMAEYTDKYIDYFPNATVYFKQLDNESTEVPIEIRLSGAEESTLRMYAQELKKELKNVNGLMWIRDDSENSQPYIDINKNTVQASRVGISNNSIAMELSNEYGGFDVGQVWDGDYSIPIKLKSLQNADSVVSDINNSYIPGTSEISVPLRQVADISTEWYNSQQPRRNGIPTLTVMTSLKYGTNANSVFPQVKEIVNNVQQRIASPDIKITYGGFDESDAITVPYIISGLSISVFIIFLILLFHYHKISLAVLTLSSTILCFFGAIFGIYISGLEFGITSILGVVCLFGIIVRNGVILFDYAEMLRKKYGMPVKEAAIEAAKRRMRPIVLTSLAASTGVIPMLLSGSPLWAPMAAVICSGVLISMLFILSVLPVAYWLVFRNHDKNNKMKINIKKSPVIVFICLLISVHMFSQDNYTLDQMKLKAKENNVSLKSAMLSIEQSKEKEKEAFTHYFPKIEANGIGFHSPDGLLGQDLSQALSLPAMKNGIIADLTVAQPIFEGGQIYNSNKLSKLNTDINKLQADDFKQDVMLLIEQNFWKLYILQENEQTINVLDSMTNKLHTEVKNSVDAGVTTKNELLQVELRQREIESQRLQITNGIKTYKSLLSQLMGIDNTHFNIIVDENYIVNPAEEYIDSKTALSSTNKYQLLDKNIEAAKLDEKLELGKLLPKVSVGASYTYHDLLPTNQSSMTYFLSVTVPISDWWGGSHVRKQKQIAARMAEYNKQDLSQKMLIEMNNLRNELDECYGQIKIAQSSIGSATENMRLSSDYYTEGMVTMSNLLESQGLFQQAKNKMAESYALYMIKKAQYKKATGR
ncbi:efflux RND transporter permease subunit [Dysgonomonas capnocytophagoides]|uniref:efflux RND transporter permease subunit n=1 Tax=Dysgonomonas capnocytophagoides TaxID=45254 RepID=UPI00333FD371